MQVETSRERLDRLKQVSRDLRWHGEYLRGLGQGIALAEEILAERDAATARAEAADLDRDKAQAHAYRMEKVAKEQATLAMNAEDERDAAIAERDRLRAALEPFAHRAEEAIALVGQDAEPMDLLVKAVGRTNWNMFRNARAALTSAKEAENG